MHTSYKLDCASAGAQFGTVLVILFSHLDHDGCDGCAICVRGSGAEWLGLYRGLKANVRYSGTSSEQSGGGLTRLEISQSPDHDVDR